MRTRLYAFENIREVGRDAGIAIFEARRQGPGSQVVLYEWPLLPAEMPAARRLLEETLASLPDLDPFSTPAGLWVAADRDRAVGVLSRLRALGLFHVHEPLRNESVWEYPQPVVARAGRQSPHRPPILTDAARWFLLILLMPILGWVGEYFHHRDAPPRLRESAPANPVPARPPAPRPARPIRHEIPEPLIQLQPLAARVACGDKFTLSWSVANSVATFLDGEPVPPEDRRTFTMTAPRRFDLTAKGVPDGQSEIRKSQQSNVALPLALEREWDAWRTKMRALNVPDEIVNSTMEACQKNCVVPSNCK